jgi:hypothetical protein
MFLDKEQKMSLRSLAFAAAAALALTTAFVPAVEARPPGPPHGGGPGWHRPPPPPHFGPRFHHHRHYGWLWAPAIAGATIWGLSTLYDDPYDDYVTYRYRYPYTPYVPPSYVTGYSAALSAERSALRAEAAANAAQAAASTPKTVYWCEAEKGFYPQVRACPTGWTPVVAP